MRNDQTADVADPAAEAGTGLRPVRPDLWETPAHSPFPGLITHAYLWTPPDGGNVLFYSVGTDADLDELEARGGVAHQYLSHRDEAGPALADVGRRFGATLHASARERDEVGRFAEVHDPFTDRHVGAGGVEVIPTPGHSPGSTSYLVPGAGGEAYLFTGDTLFAVGEGRWRAGNLRGSDTAALAASLDLLAALEPDLVVSSAAPTGEGVHAVDPADWPALVASAAAELPD